jgi:hypothetical protein
MTALALHDAKQVQCIDVSWFALQDAAIKFTCLFQLTFPMAANSFIQRVVCIAHTESIGMDRRNLSEALEMPCTTKRQDFTADAHTAIARRQVNPSR